MSKVLITETVLRDAQQSLAAARMTTDEMLPILDDMDKVGYHAIEAWGGATFDSCLRFLHEDPWVRLRKIKDRVKNTKLQMLFRGQNILGYRHYADDVVEYFVQKSIANGIDIIRIFDALNDPRNLETAIKATIKEGGHVQAAISYTTSPFHSNEGFAQYAKQLEQMGAHSICIKDMAGLLKPFEAYQLIKIIKSTVSIPVGLHTHYTAGMGSMTLLKAIEAGADIVDTTISPLAMGTSHAPTESLVATLQGTPYDTGLDLVQLDTVAKYFNKIREKYIANGLIDQSALKVDVNALRYQVPGGMLVSLISQLKMAGKLDKLDEVLEEVASVRADAGFPPLVTPASQIIGTQAINNVLFSNEGRYSIIAKEFKNLIKGEYGRCPAPINDNFKRKIIGDEEAIDYRPADKIAPEIDSLRQRVAPYREQDEDLLSLALFEQVAIKYFDWRKQQKYLLDSNRDQKNGIHAI